MVKCVRVVLGESLYNVCNLVLEDLLSSRMHIRPSCSSNFYYCLGVPEIGGIRLHLNGRL